MSFLMRCLATTLFLVSFLLFGCEEAPFIRFDEFAVKKPVNLERLLGRELLLTSATDTLALHIQFEAATGRNLITSLHNRNDTMLFAQVLRQRGMYYVVELVAPAGCQVYAMRVSPGKLRGLCTGYAQMSHLSAAVQRNKLTHLIRYQNSRGDSTYLRFDAKELRTFYATMLDTFPDYRLSRCLRPAPAAVPSLNRTTRPSAHPTLLLQSLYPNPAATTVTLKLTSKRVYEAIIYDQTGKVVQLL